MRGICSKYITYLQGWDSIILCKFLSSLCGGLDRWLGGLEHFCPLAEDPGSVPTTDMAAYNHLQLQFQRLQWPFLASIGTCIDTVHMNTHTYT